MGRKSNGEKKNGIIFPTTCTLDPGDVICPKCEGSGWLHSNPDGDWESTCNRCWGTGKLDWIERIMGKPNPRRTLKANWTIEQHDDLHALYGIDMEQEVIDAMGQELAEKIDEEIIGKMINFSITKSKLR